MEKYNESPFFLLMHPSPDPEAKDLPLALYEAELHAVREGKEGGFVTKGVDRCGNAFFLDQCE
jgi:hypothetical protein